MSEESDKLPELYHPITRERVIHPGLAAIISVAQHYAAPWLVPEKLTKYAKDSGLNALLSVPGLPRDQKKKMILGHLTVELTKAFNGVGDARIPPTVAEIIAEEWCDKLPIDTGEDWAGALNAAFGGSDDGDTKGGTERKAVTPRSGGGGAWVIGVAIFVGLIWVAGVNTYKYSDDISYGMGDINYGIEAALDRAAVPNLYKL